MPVIRIIKTLVVASTSFLAACTVSKSTGRNTEAANLIIYYDPEEGKEDLLKAADKYGSKILYIYENINGIAVTVPEDRTEDNAIRYFSSVRGVLSVVRDRIMQLQ